MATKKNDKKQLDFRYNYDPTWIKLQSSILKSESALKEMGAVPFVVMCILRAHRNLKGWGDAYPSVKTIAARMGKTPQTIHNALKKLKKLKYIDYETKGKRNHYTLMEGSEMTPTEGNEDLPIVDTRFPYDPIKGDVYVKDLKHMAETGELPEGSKVVIVNKITNNFTLVQQAEKVVINGGTTSLNYFERIADRMISAGKEEAERQGQDIPIVRDTEGKLPNK
jgi:hypothetical protein